MWQGENIFAGGWLGFFISIAFGFSFSCFFLVFPPTKETQPKMLGVTTPPTIAHLRSAPREDGPFDAVLLLWQFCLDGDTLQETPRSAADLSEFQEDSAYVALLSRKTGSTASLDLPHVIFHQSLTHAVTPRGMASSLNPCSKFQQGSSKELLFSHDVFVWNGRSATALLSSFAL